MSNEERKTPSLECPKCGGQLEVDGLQDSVECQYCGTNYNVSDLLNESDAVSIEKIKARAYKDIETGKQQTESERLKCEIEKEDKQIVKENALAFRKSKFSKVLIVFMIFSVLMCATSFNDSRILSGILSIVIIGLFVVSYLMGMQVIKEKKHNIRVFPAILAFILFVPYFSLYSSDSSLNKTEKFAWNDMELCDVLPEPSSNRGYIYTNTKTELRMDISKISSKEYNNYIEECKNSGFTVDSDSMSITYEAYNEDGYHLSLIYAESMEELSINLEAPMDMTEIQWPNSDISKLIPIPKSKVGNISWEGAKGFLIYVSNSTISDYNEYVNACTDKGFTVDYDKGDNFYYADNGNGYHLSLSYEGNNIMSIRLEESSTETSSDATDVTEKVAENTESKETEDTSTTDSNVISDSVTPDFKEAMDSYEAFFDEYIAFINKYNESDDATSMLADYTKYMNQYADTMSKMDAIDENELSVADRTYYIEVQTRITQKLLEVAQ